MDIKKNDVIDIKIEDLSSDGAGIGKVDGFTFFVKDSVPGDEIRAGVLKIKKNYGFARVIEIIKSSDLRVEAPCLVHRPCGGCQLMSLSYDGQLSFKEKRVRDSLTRIGGFDPEIIDSVMDKAVGMDVEENEHDEQLYFNNKVSDKYNPAVLEQRIQCSTGNMSTPLRYRNKAQYPVGRNKDGKIVAGFYAGRSHNIVESRDCLLGIGENKNILSSIIKYMEEYNVDPYDEATGKGLIRHVLIRKGFNTGEIMVCLVVNGKKLPMEEELIRNILKNNISYDDKEDTNVYDDKESKKNDTNVTKRQKKNNKMHYCVSQIKEEGEYGEIKRTEDGAAESEIKSICININTERNNVILGSKTRVLWGEPYIKDTIQGVTFKISAQSFYQVNPVQIEKLYSKAVEYAGLTGTEKVWDLYCGIGTISLIMASKAKTVLGVETVERAIIDAKENASLNNITNAEFIIGDAEDVVSKIMDDKKESTGFIPDVVVVDPPRKGCDEKCLRAILKAAPSRIVYVSCDPATLARDLRILCDGGYSLKKVSPYDLFPQTVHVEVVTLLSKSNRKADSSIKLSLDMDEYYEIMEKEKR